MPDTARLLDVLINGPVNATTADPRDRAQLVDAICADIAAGSDVTDACAASSVAPGAFLAWTVDDDAAAAAYTRALKIRARLLADSPVRAARELGRVLAGSHGALGFGKMGEVVGAIKARAELEGQAAERGEPVASVNMTENVVRIVFDPLPVHHQVAPTDTQSTLPSAEHAKLSDAVPATYVVVDELDG